MFNALAKDDGYYLRGALADVREAIKSPKDTGSFCYRAIESLKSCCTTRNAVAPKSDDAWELFRNTYSIAKDEIMAIKAFADAPRHGNYQRSIPMSDKDRAGIFKKTWEILAKYILREKMNLS